MPLPPTSAGVAAAWLRLAAPGISGVGRRLPAVDDAMRAGGFIRVQVVGGHTELYVPMRSPVVVCECWWPPLDDRGLPPWNHAGRLAQQLVDGSYSPALASRRVTPTPGDYAPAMVHTVALLDEPQEVLDDPSHFARQDLRLQITWSLAAPN